MIVSRETLRIHAPLKGGRKWGIMSKAAGNVWGLEGYVNTFLFDRAYALNIVSPTTAAIEAHCAVVPSRLLDFHSDERFDYELTDTAGYLKLWRLKQVAVVAIGANDGFLGIACANYVYHGTIADQTAVDLSTQMWGTDPVCQANALPISPLGNGLYFMTANHAAPRAMMRNNVRDVVVAIGQSNHAVTLDQKWASCLDQYWPEQAEFTPYTFPATETYTLDTRFANFTVRGDRPA